MCIQLPKQQIFEILKGHDFLCPGCGECFIYEADRYDTTQLRCNNCHYWIDEESLHNDNMSEFVGLRKNKKVLVLYKLNNVLDVNRYDICDC